MASNRKKNKSKKMIVRVIQMILSVYTFYCTLSIYPRVHFSQRELFHRRAKLKQKQGKAIKSATQIVLFDSNRKRFRVN